MSNTKNAIEMHLESLGVLNDIRILEIELQSMSGIISAAIINSRPVETIYLDTKERLEDEIETKRKRYMQQNALLKNLMSND